MSVMIKASPGDRRASVREGVLRTMADQDPRGGDEVQPSRGAATGRRTVAEKLTWRLTRMTGGQENVHDATAGAPAHLVRQAHGDDVLASGSEGEPA